MRVRHTTNRDGTRREEAFRAVFHVLATDGEWYWLQNVSDNGSAPFSLRKACCEVVDDVA